MKGSLKMYFINSMDNTTQQKNACCHLFHWRTKIKNLRRKYTDGSMKIELVVLQTSSLGITITMFQFFLLHILLPSSLHILKILKQFFGGNNSTKRCNNFTNAMGTQKTPVQTEMERDYVYGNMAFDHPFFNNRESREPFVMRGP